MNNRAVNITVINVDGTSTQLTIEPKMLVFGSTPQFQTTQWLLYADELSSGERLVVSMTQIHSWESTEKGH